MVVSHKKRRSSKKTTARKQSNDDNGYVKNPPPSIRMEYRLSKRKLPRCGNHFMRRHKDKNGKIRKIMEVAEGKWVYL